MSHEILTNDDEYTRIEWCEPDDCNPDYFCRPDRW